MLDFGKILLIIGGILLVLGLVFTFGPKIPFLGKLPGDISMQKGNFGFYFPLGTSILLSILLTIGLNLFLFWKR